jgi:FMN phosphatase YigB (HAD superfamily)
VTASPAATVSAVFFDFDGTLTDVDACAAPFLEAFQARIGRRAGLEKGALHDAWARLSSEIDAFPARHGWVVDGDVVAPACADPYLRASRAAKLLLVEARDGDRDGPIDRSIEEEVDEDFAESYRHVATVFREETAEIVDAVLASGRAACVVTNTRGAWVEKRLATLPLRFGPLPVAGEAAKWAIAPSSLAPERLAEVPELTTVDGLARPVLLRRGRYLDALVGMERSLGVPLSRVLICGDVFELDLCMPHVLGAHVHLLTRASTPGYERAAIERMARAGQSTDLHALRERLGIRKRR